MVRIWGGVGRKGVGLEVLGWMHGLVAEVQVVDCKGQGLLIGWRSWSLYRTVSMGAE